MKKNIFFIAITLAFLVLVLVIFLKGRKENCITLYGNIEIRQTDLAFRVSGRLLKLYVEEGDEVKEGQLIAELDSDIYKTSLKEAKAAIKEKRALKIKETQNYELNAPLCKDFTVSKEECINLKENMNFAIAQYEEAVSNLEKTIINLDDTKLYAPYNGTILSRIREKGTILQEGETVYSISMTEPVWVRTYIDETNLSRIKLGQKAFIYTDSRPKNPYMAHIGFISPVAEFTPKTVETTSLRTDLVYRLRVIIDNTDSYLRQGMPVTIKVLEDE